MGTIQDCGQAFVLNSKEAQNRKGQYFLVTEVHHYHFKRLFNTVVFGHYSPEGHT